jgi:hypothetical protein
MTSRVFMAFHLAQSRRKRQGSQAWNSEASKWDFGTGYAQECAHDRNKTASLFNHLVRDGEYFVRNL